MIIINILLPAHEIHFRLIWINKIPNEFDIWKQKKKQNHVQNSIEKIVSNETVELEIWYM